MVPRIPNFLNCLIGINQRRYCGNVHMEETLIVGIFQSLSIPEYIVQKIYYDNQIQRLIPFKTIK